MKRELPERASGVLACVHVQQGTRPVALVIRDDDWQFLCGETDHDEREGWTYVHFAHVLDGNSTLREMPALADGEQAERSPTQREWKIVDARSQRVEDEIRRRGFSVVFAENEEFTAAYSVGLQLLANHSELCCFGLERDKLNALVTYAAEQVVKGETFSPYSPTRVIFPDVDVFCVPVPDEVGERWFPLMAEWHRRHAGISPMTTVQLIWPDNDLRYPWDTRASAKLRRVQPVPGSETREFGQWRARAKAEKL